MLNWLRRVLAPPIFADEDKTRVAQILNGFLWGAIGVLSILIFSRTAPWVEIEYVPSLVLLAILIVLAVGQIMIRRGYVRGASMFLVGALWVAMTYQAWAADGIRDAAIIVYIVVIIFSSLVLGWRFASVMGGLSIVAIWYFAIMEKQGARIFRLDDPLSYARDFSVIIILIGVLIYLLISSWSRTLQSARFELQERLRAEEKLQKQADYLTALNETALGLLNRSELRPLLESILARACDLIDTKHAVIELVLPDGSALRQEVAHDILSKYNGTLTLKNEGMAGSVWASGETLVVQDYLTWDKGLPEFIEAGITAVIGVPLKVGNNVIGVLATSFVETGRTFTREEINLMERFAALASLAIDNAHLYEQAQKEIHERSMVEVELRASEERFRKVFQASPVAICITTLDTGILLDGNDAYWKMSGYDSKEVLGHNVQELDMWDSIEDRHRFVEEIKVKHSILNSNYEFLTYLTHEHRFAIALYELIEIKDQICVLSMFYDITEQKQAEQTLKNTEARTRAILTSIPDMIFEISSDGTLLDFMASSEIAPLMPPSEFLGRNIKELFPPVIADQTFFALERALATGQLHAFEYELSPGGEVQYFEARIMAISSKSAIIMVRDISQRKYVQTEREKLINESGRKK